MCGCVGLCGEREIDEYRECERAFHRPEENTFYMFMCVYGCKRESERERKRESMRDIFQYLHIPQDRILKLRSKNNNIRGTEKRNREAERERGR